MRKLLFILILTLVITGCNKKLAIVDTSDKVQTQQVVSEDINSKQDNIIEKVFNKNKLDLSNTGLTQISQDVFKKTNLEELNISNNNLTGALPGEIRHLQKLEILDASNNQMTGVPAEVGQLQNLRVLNLANNQLTGLPYELGNLKNLQILNLSGNNYSTIDMDIIRQGLPADVDIIL